MELQIFCPHWGNERPFPEFCARVKEAGYDGVEMDLPLQPRKRRDMLKILRDQGLLLIGQYWQSLEPSFAEHREMYKRYLDNLIEAEPVLINGQTGKDYFSFSQNMALVKIARQRSEASGIRILHETHRGKFLYNLPVCVQALKEDPDMELTFDASHWCTVHESMLEDQEPALKKAIRAAGHVHARLGFPEGPQVNDPSAPEWTAVRERFFSWWDQIVQRQSKRGGVVRFTTEFGPWPYMPMAPFTQKPLADQWKVNLYMKELLRARYEG